MPSIMGYPKVYAIGHRMIEDIFEDEVLVQEKLDGSQMSAEIIDGRLYCKSHRQAIDINAPGKMFAEAVQTVKALFDGGSLPEGIVLRGECLSKPKHNVINYGRIPKGNFIIFDIQKGSDILSYEETVEIADALGLEVVPLFFKGMVASPSDLLRYLEKESILGNSKVEGIVIKNYRKTNISGFCVGKIVREDFKERHSKQYGNQQKKQSSVLEDIATALKTKARWRKAVQHLEERGELTHAPQDIPLLLKEIHMDLEEEESDYISKRLIKWGFPLIKRLVCRGAPQWYKNLLKENMFGESDAVA